MVKKKKNISGQVKGEKLKPFSSKLRKERIQSVQLAINLLGQLPGQVEKNIKSVQAIQPCFRNRTIYTTPCQEEKKEKMPEKSQIKIMFDKVEDILKEKKKAPKPILLHNNKPNSNNKKN